MDERVIFKGTPIVLKNIATASICTAGSITYIYLIDLAVLIRGGGHLMAPMNQNISLFNYPFGLNVVSALIEQRLKMDCYDCYLHSILSGRLQTCDFMILSYFSY